MANTIEQKLTELLKDFIEDGDNADLDQNIDFVNGIHIAGLCLDRVGEQYILTIDQLYDEEHDTPHYTIPVEALRLECLKESYNCLMNQLVNGTTMIKAIR